MSTAFAPKSEQHMVPSPETVYGTERERLLRFCTRVTGDAGAAEDLVQEVLLEAWRHEQQLRDPERRVQWLFGIARNVCFRWARTRGRILAREVPEPEGGLDELVAGGVDVELELERSELAELLDHALSMLPPDTRRVLVGRYVEDLPQMEIAAHLGVSEGAVAVRLHRGKLALRRVLVTQFKDEAATYGLVAADAERWQQTQIWCPTCGNARFEAFVDAADHTFILRCPGCRSQTNTHSADYLHEVKGFRRMLVRAMREAHTLFFSAIATGAGACCCGRQIPLRPGLPPEFAGSADISHGVHLRCERCDVISHQSVYGLALSLPEIERFWRRHHRIRMGSVRRLDVGGRDSLVTAFESVADSARIEVALDARTFEVVGINGTEMFGRPEEEIA